MIDPGYAGLMARYNSWQNGQLMPLFETMSPDALTRDRGAFFGSILGTANHLMWGDMMWMSRFDPELPRPDCGISDSPDLHPTAAAWSAARFQMDGKIRVWASGLRALDLRGELHWYSSVLRREMVTPLGAAVVHMFNHQTHHRGQIHAMLTAEGLDAPVSDILAMPEEF